MRNHIGFFMCVALSALPLGAQQIELPPGTVRQLPPAVLQRLQENDPFPFRGGWVRKATAVETSASILKGTLPLVIIPALFADSDPPAANISSAALQSRLFGSSSTTVTAYYSEVSFGNLTINGQVMPWTNTGLTLGEVAGQNFGMGVDGKVRDWIRQAVANADASTDFRQFDNDGPDGVPNSGDDDGRVDGAAFLFREVDAACGGNGLWPHRSRLSNGTEIPPAVTNDLRPNGQPVVVDDYMVLSARDCLGSNPLEVNVLAHETGHILGLPDYYDLSAGILREQRRWVVGCWEIMSAGAWGCGSGPRTGVVIPTHMSPFPKMFFGWITPRVVTPGLRPQKIELRPAHVTGDAIRIPLSQREHLLIEYRATQGFDAGLPGSGVLVYHLETGRSFLPCPTCPRTYSYALKEADGDSALVRFEPNGGNRGAGSDAYNATRTLLDDSTRPSTRLNDGTPTWVRISQIVVDAAAGLARITVSLSPARINIDALVAALGMTRLDAADEVLLDKAANNNGRFDVGDFRAYVRFQAEAGN